MIIVKIILFIFMDYKHAMMSLGTLTKTTRTSKYHLLGEGKHVGFVSVFLT